MTHGFGRPDANVGLLDAAVTTPTGMLRSNVLATITEFDIVTISAFADYRHIVSFAKVHERQTR
jgi:hypothetical protein